MAEHTNALKIRAEVPREKISELIVLLAVGLTKNYPDIGPEFIHALARRKAAEQGGVTLIFIALRPYYFGWEEANKGYTFTIKALTKQESIELLRENPKIAGRAPKNKVRTILDKCEDGTDQKQAERDLEAAKMFLHTFFINNRIKDELL